MSWKVCSRPLSKLPINLYPERWSHQASEYRHDTLLTRVCNVLSMRPMATLMPGFSILSSITIKMPWHLNPRRDTRDPHVQTTYAGFLFKIYSYWNCITLLFKIPPGKEKMLELLMKLSKQEKEGVFLVVTLFIRFLSGKIQHHTPYTALCWVSQGRLIGTCFQQWMEVSRRSAPRSVEPTFFCSSSSSSSCSLLRSISFCWMPSFVRGLQSLCPGSKRKYRFFSGSK